MMRFACVHDSEFVWWLCSASSTSSSSSPPTVPGDLCFLLRAFAPRERERVSDRTYPAHSSQIHLTFVVIICVYFVLFAIRVDIAAFVVAVSSVDDVVCFLIHSLRVARPTRTLRFYFCFALSLLRVLIISAYRALWWHLERVQSHTVRSRLAYALFPLRLVFVLHFFLSLSLSLGGSCRDSFGCRVTGVWAALLFVLFFSSFCFTVHYFRKVCAIKWRRQPSMGEEMSQDAQ